MKLRNCPAGSPLSASRREGFARAILGAELNNRRKGSPFHCLMQDSHANYELTVNLGRNEGGAPTRILNKVYAAEAGLRAASFIASSSAEKTRGGLHSATLKRK